MKLVHITSIPGSYDVRLYRRENGLFDVHYGAEKHSNLFYREAAQEFGQCVMHSLQCAGQLDDQED